MGRAFGILQRHNPDPPIIKRLPTLGLQPLKQGKDGGFALVGDGPLIGGGEAKLLMFCADTPIAPRLLPAK